ncbi:dynein gamma flagellar outer arm-like [Brachionus plicatilis]|uniref:Dynein gamma flagellar outer arm-like n=1 Tax=Brachionus plicatilis TaxID=10195 RepID=A0A3M7PU70_BRAPC|nr:dynein gamma flagellar outer arm-like [Brachionus plicatilis]
MKGSIVCGKPNSGKTQISKGLAQYMGKFMYILYCSGQTDHSSIANCLQGVAQEGSWILFDELQNLSELCLSWFNEYSSGIYQALRKRSSLVQLSDGKEMSVNPNFCLISTLNVSKQSGQVPLQLRSMFRVIALLEPDIEVIIKAKCIQYGVKGSNILATRLKTIYDLCQASLMSLQSKYQLTISTFLCVIRIMYDKQNLESGDSRPGSLAGAQSANKYSAAKLEMLSNQTSSIKELPRKNRLALANYSKSEHAQIGQMLIDNITPRLDSNDSKTFKKIVQEILMFKEDSKIAQSNHAANLTILEKIITEKSSNDYGFFPNKNWIDKCLQIYTVSNTFEGIILCGQPCTGKTSTLNVLVDALTELGERDLSASQNNFVFKQKINSHHAHKIRNIFGALFINCIRNHKKTNLKFQLIFEIKALADFASHFSKDFTVNCHFENIFYLRIPNIH